jgi:predicted acyltransferase
MRYADIPSDVQTHRVVSLDALRGFNFIWILGGEGAALALADMLDDKGPILGAIGNLIGPQFSHARWEGYTFYDIVFPLFIFITGVATALSMPRLVERRGMAGAYWRIIRRSLILYVLGLIFYGGISEHWEDIRYVGVLQRIAACYLVTSILFLHLGWRGLVAVSVGMLVGYWAVMTFVPVPGFGTPSFLPDANLANWIDRTYLPGRLWDQTRDPEGLLSTFPAIVNCLMGALAGLLLRNTTFSEQRKALTMIGSGIVLVLLGHLWGLQFPIIKAIWTSSFVLVSGGWSLMLLGVFYLIVDVWGYRAWTPFLVWIGANAITLYFFNNLVGFERIAVKLVGGDFSRMLDEFITPDTGRFVAHSVGLAIAIAVAGFMYRRKVLVRA